MFVSAVLVYTIGVFVTSLGKHSWRNALNRNIAIAGCLRRCRSGLALLQFADQRSCAGYDRR